jgi:hypothetical protein
VQTEFWLGFETTDPHSIDAHAAEKRSMSPVTSFRRLFWDLYQRPVMRGRFAFEQIQTAL